MLRGIFEKNTSFYLEQFIRQFFIDLQHASWYEWLAVVAGIVSVWFSRKENVLVYPVGLINTVIYVYISFREGLAGEASVNFYYTVMSIIGWYMWMKKGTHEEKALHITGSSRKEIFQQFVFFSFFYIAIFAALTYFQKIFFPGAIPWADAFASATAFTGMWLMNKKKVESWYWWIATNIASIPLYYVKGLALTGVYYLILLILAVAGLISWSEKRKSVYSNN